MGKPFIPTCSPFPLTHECWGRCVQCLLRPWQTDAASDLYRRYISTRYSEPQRHYHTLEHLEEMLRQLREYQLEAPEAQRLPKNRMNTYRLLIMDLSILFHDVVYNPQCNDNEERSVDWFQDFWAECSQLASAATSEDNGNDRITSCGDPQTPLLWTNADNTELVKTKVEEYILATKHHMSVKPLYIRSGSKTAELKEINKEEINKEEEEERGRNEEFLSTPPDLHLFLDLDLAILGSDAERYQRYAREIRSEYNWYNDVDFCRGRSAFLRGFLDHSQWYKTKFFCDRLEDKARSNVLAEVNALEAQVNQTK
ncbi:uncharacterized protein TM35_000241920 [Trypanosoma theileri]|uniref:Uncharacterized protein n=1 Tax=Trypanosoma theileri TaxID=67003 RepID=A0A1X0NQQ5_9TRYP|nr:uncharacterized protein TM35_000241920 [Trypanosoma theileri]ORC87042.1 hypothetical protein TM35_000241920 [Trypanosoma theileri]